MEVPSLYDQGVHLQGEGMRHSRGGQLLYRYHESELELARILDFLMEK